MAIFNVDYTIQPNQIRNTELQNGNQIRYQQSWRALKTVKKLILGDKTELFKKIPSFLENLSQVDPLVYW